MCTLGHTWFLEIACIAWKIGLFVCAYPIVANLSKHPRCKQVDTPISKNQALPILYHEHIKLPWIETHKNLIPTKLNNDTVQFYC